MREISRHTQTSKGSMKCSDKIRLALFRSKKTYVEACFKKSRLINNLIFMLKKLLFIYLFMDKKIQ